VVSELKHIKSLILGGEIDLNLLAGLRSLNELHLHYLRAEKTDLSPLAQLESLKHLCVPARGKEVNISDELRKNISTIKSAGLQGILTSVVSLKRLY
jgi:hypothetical protein